MGTRELKLWVLIREGISMFQKKTFSIIEDYFVSYGGLKVQFFIGPRAVNLGPGEL